jgi:hypothetical protein
LSCRLGLGVLERRRSEDWVFWALVTSFLNGF